MRPSSLLHLYRVRLRSRLVQELLALVGIAVGVALVFSALVANTSLVGSVRQLATGIFGDATLQLSARGPEGIDERLLDAVRALDGVAAATATLEVQANLTGPRGSRAALLIGGEPRYASHVGSSLLRPFGVDQLNRQRILLLPESLAGAIGASFGQPTRVEAGARSTRVTLSLPLRRDDIGDLVSSPVALAPLPFAQDLSGMRGRVSRILVTPAAGREREVAAALTALAAGRATVRAPAHDVALLERAAYPTSRSTTMFSLFSALVGFLFAFSAVLLTLPQRRRLVTDLRMAGHDPWTQVQLLLFDALVLGAVGALLGLLLGAQLARHLFDSVPGYLAYAFSIGNQRIVTWQSVAIAGGAGLVAAVVAVLAPLRDILLRSGADQRAATDPRRRVRAPAAAGLACLAPAAAIVALAPRAALVGLPLLTLALLLLLPTLLRAGVRGFAVASRALRSPVPTLAVLELRSGSARPRSLALAATGAVAVFATVAIGGAHADLQRGLDTSAREIDANGDVWASFPGTTNAFAIAPFGASPATIERIRRLPGVDAVHVYRGSFLDVGDRRTWVQAPSRAARAPFPPSQLRDGDLARASARMRGGGWVVLSEALAADLGVGVGDPVRLPTPVPTTLRVAALSTNLGWPPGAIVLNADDYARAWGSATPSALQIELATDAAPAQVAAQVRRALPAGLPANVETVRQRTARHFDASRDGLSRLSQISALVLTSAMLAMAAAMGGMIWQRRPALAALKVHGYPEGELWRALLLESGLLLGTGCLVGAVFGLFGQVLLSRALASITGFPIVYSTAGVVALATLALVTAVAVAMIAIPGWLAVRVRPAPGGAAG